ncbi:hypothetical protein K1719_025342 [Acacia pycnantha]|nr:hypothetical protein K1719_025342 [Acacia pycnantha]
MFVAWTLFPSHAQPAPEECRAVRDTLLALHGFPQEFAKYRRKSTDDAEDTAELPALEESVLDGLVRTVLSQNTTEANSQRAFASLKSAFPTWEDVCSDDDERNVDIVYEPPRDGPTLWEIGIPDRSAAEFYVPDPNPKYINKLYVNHPDKFRQHGLWERYAELYLEEDLVYTVDVSDYGKDWFFAQVTRKKDDGTYQGTTWQIKFKLDNVRVNDPEQDPAVFTTGLIGEDNTIARHGIHGLYWLYSIDVEGGLLIEGDNTLYLTQTRATGPVDGIMYDYIRLESPQQ